MPSSSPLDDAAIVVPVRSFVLAKARLANVLDADARALLARTMADCVVDAAQKRVVVIVSSAPEVCAWARDRELELIADPGTLDGAADAGHAWARDRAIARYVVVHADLPHASNLDAVAGGGAEPLAIVVPDHRGDGTPVLSLPTATPFTFAYGPGSAARHEAEARHRGLDVRILHDADLAFDVDLPSDLECLG
jgi:2-phospho-L-lactate guanylyltransferase